tara:strand:+ start:287 stop:463 length:177 start_codon:yes stop_codon:yes gene_type:complete
MIHYTTEMVREYPNYSCPPYCDVDHKHIENDKEIEGMPKHYKQYKKDEKEKVNDKENP